MQIIITIKKDVRRSPNLVQNEHEHLICAFDSRLRSASASTRRSNHLSGAKDENLSEIKKLFDKKIKQWQKAKSFSLSDFMLFVSLELRLRASKKNGKHFSYYITLLDKGDRYVLRISDHHFDAATDKYHKAKKTTAITFSAEDTEEWDYFKPDNSTTATEYVYYESKMGKNEFISIARDIVTFIETGNYPSTIPPEEINHSPQLEGLQGAPNENDPYETTHRFDLEPAIAPNDIAQGVDHILSSYASRKMASYMVLKYLVENEMPANRWLQKISVTTKKELETWCKNRQSILRRRKFALRNKETAIVNVDEIKYKAKIQNIVSMIEEGKGTIAFAQTLAEHYEAGESYDWRKAQEMGEAFKIKSKQELMQACELAVVLAARKIAHNGQSLAQRFAALKDLYEQQVIIQPLDSRSKILQQYSTPCPLAFLLGEYVNQGDDLHYLEPSAGNGMLTIALPENCTTVNDLDEIRFKNLQSQGFEYCVNQDATKPIKIREYRYNNDEREYYGEPYTRSYNGVITNPPFAQLKTPYERNGWVITSLDHQLAIMALDAMSDYGRAAIIVGGKMWDAYWKPLSERSEKQVLFGKWKIFLGYLYAQYNVEDVIYINGDNIYRKQGTTYPIVAILINGRHKYDESIKPNYVFDPSRDTIIDTFDQLFERMMKHFTTDEKTEDKKYRLRLAKAKAKALMLYTYAQQDDYGKLNGADIYAKYQTFIKDALASKNRNIIECTDIISEHSKKIVNYLLGKRIIKYYIKSTDIRHAKNKHSKKVEYKYNQIPLTDADLLKIPEILSEPTNIDLPLSNSKNGQGIRFIKEYPDGKIYCVMVDEYETEELSVKTSYKKSPLQGNDAIVDPKLNVRNARALPMLSANITNFFRIK